MLKLSASDHALLRARQRKRWSPRTLSRMLERVFYAGLDPAECKGELRRFLKTVPHPGVALTLRIYGDDLYLFARPEADEAMLVTLYPVPSRHLRAIHLTFRHHFPLAA